jgi:hypothetical protein
MEDSYTVDGMTPGEWTEVQRVHDVVLKALDLEVWQLAQFMITRRDDQLFGEARLDDVCYQRTVPMRSGTSALFTSVSPVVGTPSGILPPTDATHKLGART